MKRNDLVFWLAITVMMILIIVLVVVYFIFDVDTSYYRPGSTWIQSPSDWIEPPSDWIQHEKAVDIKPRLLPAYRIDLADNQLETFLKPTSDGGCLAINQIEGEIGGDAGPATLQFRITRFRSNGTVWWTRQVDDLMINGYLVALCVLPDDSFALSLRSSGIQPSNPVMHDLLLRFTSNGRLLWQSPAGSHAAGSLDFLLPASDGAVLAAGTIQSSPADDATGDSDISLKRFEVDGRQSATMLVGRTGQDYLPSAAYQAATGLVLIWQHTIGQVQPGEDIALGQVSSICCYDERLQEQWVTAMPKGAMLNEVQITPGGHDILAFGTAQPIESTVESGAAGESRSTLYRLDTQGKVRWSYQTPESRAWIGAATRQAGESFVVGWYQTTPQRAERTTLLLLNADGNVETEIDNSPGIIRLLTPTQDGGLTAIYRQTVQAVPQPPFISSLWTDTEAIVSHYNQTQQLVWRRTIDQYQGVRQTDHIVATTRDILLIG